MKLYVLNYKWFLFICLILCKYTSGQDPSFSQFYNNALYYNPAYAGYLSGSRVALSSRLQWPMIAGQNTMVSFNTYRASIDCDISNGNGLGGIGLNVIHDDEGSSFLRTTSIGLPFAVRIKISKKISLQAGIEPVLLTKSIDWTKLVFSDQLDQVYGIYYQTSYRYPSQNQKWMFDLGAGLVLNYKFQFDPRKKDRGKYNVIQIGFAAHHVTQPLQSFEGVSYSASRLPVKWTVHSQVFIPLFYDKSVVIIPTFFWEKQSAMNTTMIGANFIWRFLYAGFWYRSFGKADALAVSAGFTWDNGERRTTKSISLTYSYDITLSKLAGISGGSHEISLIFDDALSFLKSRHSKKRPNKDIKCPKFYYIQYDSREWKNN